jgi:peptide/nickel transport system substrate-binding protein
VVGPPRSGEALHEKVTQALAGIAQPPPARTGQVIGLEGKKLTAAARHSAFRLLTIALALSALAVAGCGRPGSSPDAPRPVRVLVSSIRSEPRTFNRYVARDALGDTLAYLLHGTLVRINRVTQELEPWLAESWSTSSDGLTYTVKLRQGVAFSDGAPFTSADVLFAFRACYGDKAASTLGDSLLVGGKRLDVSAPDAATVVIRFPEPFGPGISLLDNLPILPQHKLDAALGAGTFAKAWGPATPPTEIVGLGPFVLKEYQAGQRLVFVRNPRYWRSDKDGRHLPLLDRLMLEIVPDQNAELLRLQSGQIDFTQTEVRPEDYATLKAAADQGRLQLTDLGVGLDADSMWFNLKAAAPAARRAWLHRVELRRAISHAVDRKAFANTVFLGAAVPVFGPVTPANTRWATPGLPKYDYDPAEARRLLASLGLADRNGDGVLDDRSGAPAEITLITQKGNTALERGSAFIRDELAKVGLAVNVVPLDVGAAWDRYERGDYEAVYLRVWMTGLDPALNIEYWLSSGGTHLWNPSQKKPATDWERQIDDLMHRQVASRDQVERKALFGQAQRVFAEQLPVLHFAAPRMIVATSTRVRNAAPSPMRPAALLWSADTLSVADSNGGR